LEEFDFFRPHRVEARRVPSVGVCPACLDDVPKASKCGVLVDGVWQYSISMDGSFVRHHWFESDGSCWEIYVCPSCNSLLSSNCPIASGDHVLPSWDVQVTYVRECRERRAVRFRRERLAELVWYEEELLLFKSWLCRSHSEKEIRQFGLSEEEARGVVTRRIEVLESRVKKLEVK